MASGTVYFSESAAAQYGKMQGCIEWSDEVLNIAENKSRVTARIYLRRLANGTTTGTWPWSITLGGSSFGGSTYAGVSTGWVHLGTKTIDVTHDEMGNATLYVGGRVDGTQSFSGYSTSGGKTVTLRTIERGIVPIDNGASFDSTMSYIDNGETVDHYLPYVDDGTQWNLIS